MSILMQEKMLFVLGKIQTYPPGLPQKLSAILMGSSASFHCLF